MKHVLHQKHILLLTFVFSPNIGGVESHLDDLTNFLSKKHSVTVITYKPLGIKDKLPFKEVRENLTIIRIPWFHPAIFNFLEKIPFIEVLYLVPPIFLYSFWYLLKNFSRIDVIQAHGFNMAIVGSILSKIFRIPVVINTHVSFYFEKNTFYVRLLRFFINQARSILVLTQESKKELVKIGIPEKKIVVYHQWIDEKTFVPHEKLKSRKKLNLDTSKFTVLFVGRFSPAKGIGILVKATEKFEKSIQLIVVGSGPLANFIKEKSQHLKQIKFIGKVSYADLPYYYSAADVVVIPSTPATQTYSEGIPRVLIESYRCSTPVVATRAGGVKEHIKSTTGIFIKPVSYDITQVINSLSKTPKKLFTLGKNAEKYAVSEFGLVKNAKIIEESLI